MWWYDQPRRDGRVPDPMSRLHVFMSTKNSLCPNDVIAHNVRLGNVLREKYKMSLFTWKTVKWLAVIGAIYGVIQANADPFITVVTIAFILGGPEVLEYLAVREDFAEYVDRKEEKERSE